MTEAGIWDVTARQRAYFLQGATLDMNGRVLLLDKLRQAVEAGEGAIADALRADLGKSRDESYMSEIGLVLDEAAYMITHVRRLSRARRVWTPAVLMPARSRVKPSPYGCVLVISDWRFPFVGAMRPLIDAVAAGNTVVLKPSGLTPSVSAVVQTLVEQVFPAEHAAVVTGGEYEEQLLLQQGFDFISYSGPREKGREALRLAAETLTPTALSLSGKSPCIIDRTANVTLAAQRIVWGKFMNCGQNRLAPDYVLVEDRVRSCFVEAVQNEIMLQFGERPLENPDYGKLVNDRELARAQRLIDPAKLVFGGMSDPDTLRMEPTVLCDVWWDDPVMQQEVCAPILPIITFSGLDEAVRMVNDQPCPPAVYLFTADRVAAKYVTERCRFGSGCVNDVLLQAASAHLPCGSMGESGMGGCHGKAGYAQFSCEKSILRKNAWLHTPVRCRPFSGWKRRIIRLLLH